MRIGRNRRVFAQMLFTQRGEQPISTDRGFGFDGIAQLRNAWRRRFYARPSQEAIQRVNALQPLMYRNEIEVDIDGNRDVFAILHPMRGGAREMHAVARSQLVKMSCLG